MVLRGLLLQPVSLATDNLVRNSDRPRVAGGNSFRVVPIPLAARLWYTPRTDRVVGYVSNTLEALYLSRIQP